MSLEQEINQSKFNNEHHKLMVNLLFTHSWFVNRIKTFLKPYGVTIQQYNVLRILRGQFPKPISTAAIRARMLDKMSDVSRIVDRLMLKGFAEKRTRPSDKRLVDVLITEKGLKVLAEIDQFKEKLEIPSNNLSEAEAQQMNLLLDKMRVE